MVIKILFDTKRSSPDTCTAVSFLTMRVREPNNDNCTMLVHLMKYIRGTSKLLLILSANGSGIIKWRIDISFAVHQNMRGLTSGGLSTVRGFTIDSSTNQKLNTWSSDETEVVAVDDCITDVLWTRYLLDAQGYNILITLSFKTIKVLLFWKRTARLQSEIKQIT